jgi:hypothetical protein
VSDIDTAVVDSLKVLDPKRPIREADIVGFLSELARSRMTQTGTTRGTANEGYCALRSGYQARPAPRPIARPIDLIDHGIRAF